MRVQTYNGALFVADSPDADFEDALQATSSRDIEGYLISEYIDHERWNFENEVIREACGE
jgi:hypothetical protein